MKAQDFILIGILLVVAAALLQSFPLAIFGVAWWGILAAAQMQKLAVRGRIAGVVTLDERLIIVGEAAKLTILGNGALKAAACWLRLRIPMQGPGTSSMVKDIVSFGTLDGDASEKAVPLRPDRPGVYVVGPPTVTVSDCLGLRQEETELGEPAVAIAYPRPKACDLRLPTPADGFGERLRLRRTAPDGKLLVGSRPYARGDSPRAIHWRLTGHTGSLMTKQLEATADPRVWVLLGTTVDDADLDLEVATSLIHHLVSDSFEVGMVAAGGLHPMVAAQELLAFTSAVAVQPMRGLRHFEPLVMGLVAAIIPADSSGPSPESLSLFQRGDIALVVGGTPLGSWLGYLESLRRRGVVVAWIERTSDVPGERRSMMPMGPGIVRGLAKVTKNEVMIEFAR